MKDGLRSYAIKRAEQYLLRKDVPRLQMLMIVTATGAAGFLFSFALLHLGVETMWIRYPVAVAMAYSVFLLLLRLWLAYQSAILAGDRGGGGGVADLLDIPVDQIADGLLQLGTDQAGDIGSGAGIADIFDLDEIVFLIVAVVAIIGALAASLYIVYMAPALFAEVLVDGFVVSCLYRRLRKGEPRHWIYGAVRRTWIPALVTVLLLGLAGYAMQTLAPTANSIGDVCRYLLG